MQNNIVVFVYGTLMNGYGNNRFLNGSDYLSRAETESKYLLTANGIPFVSKTHGTDDMKSKIKGELYAVNNDTLGRLDELEGHPNWYQREIITITTEDGVECQAWIYFNEISVGNHVLEDGDYHIYTLNAA